MLTTQVIPRRRTKRRLTRAELRAWRAFMLASAASARAMDRDAEAAGGLPLSDHHLLALLGEAPESGLRPTDLAELSPLTRSGLTRALDRLEALGLIERRTCPSDGRGLLVALSAKGRQMLRRAAPGHFRAIARHFADHLTGREAEIVAVALERVVAAARRAPAAQARKGSAAVLARPGIDGSMRERLPSAR